MRCGITSCSVRPRKALTWVLEVDLATSMAQLSISTSVVGTFSVHFETLDSNIAGGLAKILNGDEKKASHDRSG